MKLRKLRNIGIIAHVDAGKTTATERMLYLAGATHNLGNVDDGNTTTDSSEQEKAKGITISSASVAVHWNDHQINIIDTPGHVDFHVEVHRSLRVLDGAVVVFDAVSGVEPQTEANWRLADQYDVPRIALVNKMDRAGADFENVLRMMEERLNTRPVAVQLPMFDDHEFVGVIDLIEMKAMVWESNDIGDFKVIDIPESYCDKAKEYRDFLEEQLVELDDDIMLTWFAGESLDNPVIQQLLRKGCLSGYCVPVLCASAYKNIGMQSLLNAVVDYLPAPQESETYARLETGESVSLEADSEQPFAGLAFKVVNDKHGTLTYVRVYRGTLKSGDKIVNATEGKFERIGRMVLMQATARTPISEVRAGDIVAIVGLKHTTTGHSLTSIDTPLFMESIEVPKTVIDRVIEADSREEDSKLSDALIRLTKEDPSLNVSVNDSGQTVLSGLGELHLEIVIERLKSEFNVGTKTGQPQVAYRETLTEPCDVVYRHKKQDGGSGQFAVVHVSFVPIEDDDIQFESHVVGGSIPKEFIPGVEKGIREAAQNGVLSGYPCSGFKAILTDGETHDNDSSLLAFQIAGREAFKQASQSMKPKLKEPMMAVEVVTPMDYVGACMGDLSQRRGIVSGQESKGNAVSIKAVVPLSTMFGYISDLRSMTAGRASFSMNFERYDIVPDSIQRELIDQKS
ncbi:elongation factor G [Pleionea sediminis]|uniref:elongation factor G n=1 Tax=Pleionea sediminis TaxID=2569479 RepID=UPI001184FD31|nr:elongation factor G [Pleionea sediminis]